VALSIALLPGLGDAAGDPSPSLPVVASETTGALVDCGGAPFPATMLKGPRGAERGTDAPARRLAAAIAAVEPTPDALPRTGWMRVIDRPDLVLFIAWITLRRVTTEPLFAVTIAPGEAEGPAVDGWDVWAAGACWPRVVLMDGLGEASWAPAGPVGAADQSFVALVTEWDCNSGRPATGRVAEPVIVPAADVVAITFGVRPAAGDRTCPRNPPTPVVVTLPSPLGRRALVDGGTVPARVVQAPPHEVDEPLVDGEGPDPGLHVSLEPRFSTLAVASAITDSLVAGIELRRVRVVDRLELELTLEAVADLSLATLPRLCLVGPHPAPDDAGLSDRCWGAPDLSGLVGAGLPLDELGRPFLAAGVPVTVSATLARGTERCDYPAGDWLLEVSVTPLRQGPRAEQRLPSVPLTIAWQGDVPTTELTRAQSRYCGLANLVVAEQGEPPTPAP